MTKGQAQGEMTHQEISSPRAASLQDLQSNVQRMRDAGEEDMGDRKQKIQQRREEKGPTGTMVTVRYPGLTC